MKMFYLVPVVVGPRNTWCMIFIGNSWCFFFSNETISQSAQALLLVLVAEINLISAGDVKLVLITSCISKTPGGWIGTGLGLELNNYACMLAVLLSQIAVLHFVANFLINNIDTKLIVKRNSWIFSTYPTSPLLTFSRKSCPQSLFPQARRPVYWVVSGIPLVLTLIPHAPLP